MVDVFVFSLIYASRVYGFLVSLVLWFFRALMVFGGAVELLREDISVSGSLGLQLISYWAGNV